MRRFILLLICLLLILQPFNVFSDNEIATQSINDEVFLVEQLGIVSEININQTDGVSRAEFLSWAIKMGRIPTMKVGEEPEFTDVTMGHAYADYISTAYKAKIVKGNADKSFLPDNYITLDEAVIMTVNVIKSCSSLPEDSSISYFDWALRFKLYKNISASPNGVLKRIDAVKMIFNALNSEYLGNSNNQTTFLEEVWKVNTVTGIIDSTYIIKAGVPNIQKDEVYIDGNIFYQDKYTVDDFFGNKIKAYYYEENQNKIIVYACRKSSNNIVTINNVELENFTDNAITIYENNRKISYSTGNLTTYILNNSIVTSSQLKERLKFNSSKVTFIDNNGDDFYDYVIVKDPDVYIVNYADGQEEVFSSDKSDDVFLDKYPSFSIIDENENDVLVQDIKRNNVLLVYKPLDYESHLEIEFIKNTVSEAVKYIDAGNDIITFSNDEEHKISDKSCIKVDEFTLGTEYSFYLDKDGMIIYAKEERRKDYSPMYIINMANDSIDDIIAKVLNESGEVKVYKLANSINFRDQTGKVQKLTKELVYKAFLKTNNKIEKQLVLSKLNDKDEISLIYKISNSNEDLFFDPKPQSHNAYRWLSAQCSFENLIQLKASTKVFFVPNPIIDETDDEYYYTGDLGLFRNDQAYQNVNSYKDTGYGFKPVTLTPKSLESDYIVIECPKGQKFTAGSSCYGIVTDIGKSINEKSEECSKITVVNMSGVEQTFNYVMKEDSMELFVGDIIQIQYTDSTIYSRDIYMYYSYKKDSWKWYTNFDNTIGWRYYAGFRVTKGRVLEVSNGIAKCEVITTNPNYQNEFIKYNSSKILKFISSKTKKYVITDGNSIKPGDEFFAMLSGGVAKMFILYGD